MGMGVITNLPAMSAARSLRSTDESTTRSLERLSSGLRITRAADDAAGLAISEGLRAQIGGARQALRNTQDGISVVRTADGALDATTSVLQRLRDLAVQAANDGGLDDTAKAAVQTEVAQLKEELDRIATSTSFNGKPLLDGSYRGTFQVGGQVGETVTVVIGATGVGLGVEGLGLETVDVTRTGSVPVTTTRAVSDAEGVPTRGALRFAGDYVTPGVYEASFEALTGTITYDGRTFDLDSVDYTGAVTATDYLSRLTTAAMPVLGTVHTPFVGTALALHFDGATPGAGSTLADAEALSPVYRGRSGASAAITLVDRAVREVSSLRAYLGAVENRFAHTIANLGVMAENMTTSMSRIRDADVAQEMVILSRHQIVAQAGTAMLSQANRSPQSLLSLLN